MRESSPHDDDNSSRIDREPGSEDKNDILGRVVNRKPVCERVQHVPDDEAYSSLPGNLPNLFQLLEH